MQTTLHNAIAVRSLERCSFSFSSFVWKSLLVLFLVSSGVVFGQATLPVTRTIWNGSSPTGWADSPLDSYTDATACSGTNSAKLDTTGDSKVVYFDSSPSDLSFVVKSTGTSSTSVLLVEQSSNGSSYTTVVSLTGATGLPNSCSTKGPYTLNAATRYVRWTFTKGNHDLVFDDVSIKNEWSVPATGNTSISTCAGKLYDSGGVSGNYATNSSGYTIINPSIPGNKVRLSGTITAEAGYDYLTIYDGSGTGGTVLFGGSKHGTGFNCDSFIVPVVTSTTGALTVKFFSDTSTNCAGFALDISCIAPSANPVLAITGTTAHGNSCPTVAATSQTYTITNTGGSIAAGVTVVSNDAQFVVSGLSSTTIAASGGTATYTVTFTPTTAGAKTATITVASTTSGSNSPTSALTGTGLTSVTAVAVTAAATIIAGTSVTLNATSGTTFGVCPNTTEKGFVIAPTASSPTPIVGGAGVTKEIVTPLGTTGVAYTKAITGLTATTGYSYRAYLYNGSTYTYGSVVTFTTLTPPANDLCADAVALVLNAAPVGGTLVSSSFSTNTFTYKTTGKDVWYKYTTTCAGKYTITTTFASGNDIDVDVFAGPCPSSGTALFTSHSSSTTESVSATLSAATTYYIRVIAYDTAAESATFTIDVNNQMTVFTNPSNQSVSTGSTATFASSIPANATAYQWQVNTGSGWSNVTNGTGGTTNSYTTIASTMAMSGNQYRVVISNGTCNSVNSSAATLTVAPCTSVPTSNDGAGITNVVIGAANFAVTDVSYLNYTTSTPDLQQGELVVAAITFATGYTYDTHIWIDYNDDGEFNNTNEKVFTGVSLATNPTTLTTNFTVDGAAALGTHKMRIGTADNGQTTPNPCYSGTFGVTIEMMVTIVPVCAPATNPVGSISGTFTACNSTSLTYSGADAPNAYWQSASTGVSLAFPASVSLPVTSSGTYYVRTYNGDCWSTGTVSQAVVINKSPSITTQPTNKSVVVGATATFSVVATGTTLSYQWQTNASGSWANVTTGTGGTTASYTTPVTTLLMNDTGYRVVVTSAVCGSLNSAIANLSVASCIPSSSSTSDYINAFTTTGAVANSNYSSTSINAGGYGNLYNTNSITQVAGELIGFSETYVGGTHGFNIWVDYNKDGDFDDAGEKVYASGTIVTSGFTGSFTVPALTNPGNYRMRIRAQWNTTDPAVCSAITYGEAIDFKLIVTASCVQPAIATTPTSNSPQCLPTGVTVSKVGTAPTGEVWYWQTTATGTETAAVNAAATYVVTTPGISTLYLRAQTVSTACWSAPTGISVTVNAATVITTPPSSIIVYTGNTGTFNVAANGVGLSYQWQINTGSIWANTGTNSASLTTAATTLGMNGYQYRVTVTGLCGTAVVSSIATLTVTDPPCFEESYVSLTGSGTAWSGNTNFTTNGNAFEQNGALRISRNNTNGSITSKTTSAIYGVSGSVTIKMKVKGWVAGTFPIKISLGAQNTTVNFVSVGDYSSTSYSTVLHTFTGVIAGSLLTIESLATTNAARRFVVGEIELYCGVVPDNNCVPSNTISNTVFINKTTFLGTQNDIENTSTHVAEGYQDFTNLNTHPSQIQGEGINIKVNASNTAFIKAWIDTNNDGDFVDGGETIFSTDVGQSATTFGYQIPIGLPAGNYRIRIRVENYDDGYGNYNFGSCDDLTSAGETEDYILTVVARCGVDVATFSNGERCGTGSVILQASTVSSGVTQFRWYTTAVGGTYEASTVSSNATVYTTPSISETTTFYVAVYNGSCETEVRKKVIATIKDIPVISFTPEAPVSCGEFEPIALTAQEGLETVFLLDENFEGTSFAAALLENNLLVDNGSLINTVSNWDAKTSTFIPQDSQLSWLPAVSSGFGSNKFAFTTSDVGQVATDVYYTIDNALQMKNAVNTTDFETLTLSYRMYFSRYFSAGVGPNEEYVSVEVSTDGGSLFTPLLSPVKYVSSQGSPGNFGLKVIDISSYKNQTNLKFRIRYQTTTWADGVAIDDVQIYGSKKLTASYSWSGTDINVFTDAALQNPYISGDALDKVYIVPNLSLLEEASFNIVITTTLINGCPLEQTIPVTNNGKVWSGTTAAFETASNWKPSGVPTSVNCIIVPDTGIQPIIPADYHANVKTLNVKSMGIVTIPSGSSITVVDEVIVSDNDTPSNTADDGQLLIMDGGSLVQVTNVNNATTNNNTGKIVMQRITQPMNKYDYTYWSSPVAGTTLYNLSPETHPNRYYSYNPNAVAPVPNWTAITGGAAVMVAGKGYIIRAPNTYATDSYTAYTGSFSGVPNNGTVSIAVSGSDTVDKYNLLGNPYPSAISASAFVLANATGSDPATQGTLYFWTHNTPFSSSSNYTYSAGDYASWNGTGLTATNNGGVSDNDNPPNDFIAAGQGFFVQGSDTGGTAVFNNNMRASGNNMNFYRPNAAQNSNNVNASATVEPLERSRVWLNLQGGTNGFSQTLVGYIENATNDYDTLFDGPSFGGNSVTFYSINNAKNLVIQGRALPFLDTDEVPMGFKTTLTGNLTIGIDHADGLFENQTVYLKDNVLDVVHNLTNSDYVFAAVPGTFNERFVLRYLPAVDLDNPTFEEQISHVTIRKNEATLRVHSPYETIDAVMVYDIMGRLVFEKNACNTTTFEASNIVNSDQTLIVKVKLSNGGVVSKKVL
ncbi:GEVED domain-containing protein [Flavobacterium sp. SM2513]|uniref:GEVED domain-containing protein n=1 Tax=Flavobacterium sp. SM2513 TaxID=3424766 RepID=UPI003D7FC0E7